jgi:anti-sigma factor ChrR (cupin superfamily)
MKPTETRRVVIDTTKATWKPADPDGAGRLQLHLAPDAGESVTLERMSPGTRLSEAEQPGGEEIFVLSGEMSDRYGSYGAGTWIRNPAGFRSGFASDGGVTYWAKRGHLRPMS